MAPPPPRPTAHSPCLLLAVPPSPLSTGRGFHRGETSYHFCLLINLNFQDDYPLKQRSLAAAPRVPGGGRGASPATTTSKGAGLGRPPGGKKSAGEDSKRGLVPGICGPAQPEGAGTYWRWHQNVNGSSSTKGSATPQRHLRAIRSQHGANQARFQLETETIRRRRGRF